MILKVFSNQSGSMVAYCNEMTILVDKERVVNVAYLKFSKYFDTVSHGIIINKLAVYW